MSDEQKILLRPTFGRDNTAAVQNAGLREYSLQKKGFSATQKREAVRANFMSGLPPAELS